MPPTPPLKGTKGASKARPLTPAEDEASRQYQQKYSQYTPQMVAAPYGHLVPVYSAAPTAVTYPGLYPTLATTEAQPMQHPVQFQQVQYSIGVSSRAPPPSVILVGSQFCLRLGSIHGILLSSFFSGLGVG